MSVTRLCQVTAALALISLASPLITPASAHAIIELNGVSAVAGQTSDMTLEIRHGCFPLEPTVQVEAFVGKPWRAVTPKPIDGWTSTVARQPNGGWHITWVNQGQPVPFGTNTYFPITVSWPRNPGAYGMSVMQLCPGGHSEYWNVKYAPASAKADSPPLTPRPEVLVVAKGSSSSSPVPTARPSASTTAVVAHPH
jgi:uncharacterized protein YcnI